VTTKPQHTLVLRDRDAQGNVVGERTILAHSMDEALELARVKQVTIDGHICKDVQRTVNGVDAKTFCGQKLFVEIGAEGSSTRESFMARGAAPVTCWKCKDRA
jgi:hypothetical protein